MLEMMLSMFGVILKLLMVPIAVVFGVIAFFYADTMFWYLRRYIKGDRVQRGSIRQLPKRSAFMKLFVDAPKQYVDDLYNKKPDFFQPQGMIIFTGRQGYGKTSSMIQYAMELHDQYPFAKCLSNTKYIHQDGDLRHWRQLVDYKNGHKGVIVIMDELQNWFSSNQSRNFPPEMLTVITQNRKNRRVILGTAQNFYLLAKPLRSQCTEIRQCMTFAGVVTVVVRREPIVDNDGEVKEMKYRGMYFYVHSRRLREAYDTWAVVENFAKSGFHNNPFMKENEQVIEIASKK